MDNQLNLREDHTDTLISDFFDSGFQKAFRQYFAELGIHVRDWDGLFQEMNRGDEGGHGAQLLALAEQYFLEQGIYTGILTTDTAERFYRRHGYVKASGCRAKNKDEVFTKRLKQTGQPQ